MTTVATVAPLRPLTDLDIVTAFAVKTAQTGEEPVVRPLWDDRFRINYFNRDKGTILRSLFLTLSEGKIEVFKVQ